MIWFFVLLPTNSLRHCTYAVQRRAQEGQTAEPRPCLRQLGNIVTATKITPLAGGCRAENKLFTNFIFIIMPVLKAGSLCIENAQTSVQDYI
jgi:hypothetical protein